jgi:hypothetical protein
MSSGNCKGRGTPIQHANVGTKAHEMEIIFTQPSGAKFMASASKKDIHHLATACHHKFGSLESKF